MRFHEYQKQAFCRHSSRSDNPQSAICNLQSFRRGFTLIELLVAVAVIILILTVLAQAFHAGLETFGRFKAIGNMSDHLRAAAQQIRGDLAADHFDGAIRLSDPQFYTRTPAPAPAPADWPREGFFCVRQFGPSWIEGLSDGIPFYRAPAAPGLGHVLHFTVKLRGNRDNDYFGAGAPSGRAVHTQSTFFDAGFGAGVGTSQPEDSRNQASGLRPIYRSQWAEIAYYLLPLRNDVGGPLRAGNTTPLFSLHRVVLVLVPDNSRINGQTPPSQAFSWVPASGAPSPATGKPIARFFNTPRSIRDPRNRFFKFATAASEAAVPQMQFYGGVSQLLLTDVVSFHVQVLQAPPVKNLPEYNPPDGPPAFGYPVNDVRSANFRDLPVYDSATSPYGLLAIQVTLRVWDVRTQQTRQVTIIQDL